mmetsp:Transcript_13021/g.14999  ORF Transcript_13021/g.14999 Transcript_13021/m.14999 type:complete len:197 (-) Transcript_13021:392-982(-)
MTKSKRRKLSYFYSHKEANDSVSSDDEKQAKFVPNAEFIRQENSEEGSSDAESDSGFKIKLFSNGESIQKLQNDNEVKMFKSSHMPDFDEELNENTSDLNAEINSISPSRFDSSTAITEKYISSESQINFKKRTRIMSNVDQIGFKKKKISTKKKSGFQKCSISNSEFKSFYTAFEQQVKSTQKDPKSSPVFLSEA